MEEDNQNATEEEKKAKQEAKEKKLADFREAKAVFVKLKVSLLGIMIASMQLLLMIVDLVSKEKSERLRQTMEQAALDHGKGG